MIHCTYDTQMFFLTMKYFYTHPSVLAWRVSLTESLVSYSPWGHKESDTTEQLTLSLSYYRNKMN